MFDYAAPTSVDETLELLASDDSDVRLLAGGQSLMILLRQRLVAPDLVVSLKRVRELATVQARRNELALGSMVTYRQAAASPDAATWAPILVRAASSVGSLHIRNLGTVGGAVCHADPAGDLPTALLAVDATVRVARRGSIRVEPMAGFFTGLFSTCLDDRDLVVSINVPRQAPGATYGYRRFCFRAGEYPLGIGACQLEWDGSRCRAARVAVGGGYLHPVRLPAVEQQVVGTEVDGRVRSDVRADLVARLDPPGDVRGSARWKARVVARLVEQALADAVTRRAVAA